MDLGQPVTGEGPAQPDTFSRAREEWFMVRSCSGNKTPKALSVSVGIGVLAATSNFHQWTGF